MAARVRGHVAAFELIERSGRPEPRDLLSWALRVLVALIFIYEGLDKFGTRRLWIRVFAEIGIGQWFRYATGMVEIAGAVLLLVPRATPVAVVMLLCTLVGAFLAHIFIIGVGIPHSVIVGVLFAAVVAIGWRHRSAEKRGQPATGG